MRVVDTLKVLTLSSAQSPRDLQRHPHSHSQRLLKSLERLTLSFSYSSNVLWDDTHTRLRAILQPCLSTLVLPAISPEQCHHLKSAFSSLFGAYSRRESSLFSNMDPQTVLRLFVEVWRELGVVAECIENRSERHNEVATLLKSCMKSIEDANNSSGGVVAMDIDSGMGLAKTATNTGIDRDEKKTIPIPKPESNRNTSVQLSLIRARLRRDRTQSRAQGIRSLVHRDDTEGSGVFSRGDGDGAETTAKPSLFHWFWSAEEAEDKQRSMALDGWKPGFKYDW